MPSRRNNINKEHMWYLDYLHNAGPRRATRHFANQVLNNIVNAHNANILYKNFRNSPNNKNNYNKMGELKALILIDRFKSNPTYNAFMKMMTHNYGNNTYMRLGNRLKKYNYGIINNVERELKPRKAPKRKAIVNRVAMRRLFG